jgi:hypothetical protein
MGLRCHLLQLDDSIAQRLIAGERPPYDAGAALDIDKAWGGIHFLLSGSTDGGEDPPRFLMSGHMLEDVSEHVAVHRASSIASFDAVLKQTSDDTLFARMNPQEMNRLDVYPGSWTGSERDYLAGYVNELRDFISATAASGRAMTISIL